VGTVLLVDDDVMVRQMLRRTLERAGYGVREAANGAEGLELFEAELPQLVLTDIMMPVMNGLEMMVEMRRRQPGVPLIAITGSAGQNDGVLLLARDLGAARTFRKPIDRQALLMAVAELSRSGASC
jgi:CheY-like chemotaxis protein